MPRARTVFALVCGLLLSACAADNESFANRPGFTEYFDKYPPSDSLPDRRQQKLLEQYRPRIYRAVDKNGISQQGPIDFYKSYIPDGRLTQDGKIISQQVTRDILNQYRNSSNARFEYEGTYRKDTTAIGYGRYDIDTLYHEQNSYPLEFLSYNFVFPTSGLLQGIGGLQRLALSVAGSLNDWHQLDHYVGLSIALYQNVPIAISLQQHNYQTTYVLGKNLSLPADDRIALDIAMRSNELYLHSEKEVKHPAVSFITTKNIEFLKQGTNKPLMAGFDITRGDQEVEYTLIYLPQSDAFYQFKGQLGKSRLLPGRSGPPGADYATLPGLMPRAVRMVTGYRPAGVEQEQQKFKVLFDRDTFTINSAGINAYSKDFIDASAIPDP